MVQGFYLATREVAERAGVVDGSYVTQDGRFIINSDALKNIRMLPEEYVTGISGIEAIGYEDARTLIAENGYKHLCDIESEAATAERASEEDSDSDDAAEETDNNEKEGGE